MEHRVFRLDALLIRRSQPTDGYLADRPGRLSLIKLSVLHNYYQSQRTPNWMILPSSVVETGRSEAGAVMTPSVLTWAVTFTDVMFG